MHWLAGKHGIVPPPSCPDNDSGVWSQVAQEADTPALFVAMAAMLDAVVGAASDAALLAIARFLISLRADAVDDETSR